jgi:glycosyltransferase involved in cell wall biosynthesis
LNNKYVFVNRFFYPDHSATSQILSDLAFSLADAGHDVHVVCSRQLYDSPAAELPTVELINGVRVHRAWSTRFGRGRLIGRALDYLSFYVGACLCLLAVADARSVVVVKTDPPMVSVPAALVCWLRGATMINWLQDLFPEVAAALGMKLLSGRLGYFLQGLRDTSLRRARFNVVLGRRMAARLEARGISAASLQTIANWSDNESIEPIAHDQNPLVDQWGLTDRFVVMYSGNMGRAHEFGTVLDAAELLQESHPRVVFLFVGGGAQHTTIVGLVEARNLNNVEFRTYQPRAMLASSLSVGHIHLISQEPATEGLIVPSKFYGILAAGRPTLFVGDCTGEVAEVIQREHIGVSVRIGDAKGMVGAIARYAEAPEQLAHEGRAARLLLLRRYAKMRALRTWHELLAEAAKPAEK